MTNRSLSTIFTVAVGIFFAAGAVVPSLIVNAQSPSLQAQDEGPQQDSDQEQTRLQESDTRTKPQTGAASKDTNISNDTSRPRTSQNDTSNNDDMEKRRTFEQQGQEEVRDTRYSGISEEQRREIQQRVEERRRMIQEQIEERRRQILEQSPSTKPSIEERAQERRVQLNESSNENQIRKSLSEEHRDRIERIIQRIESALNGALNTYENITLSMVNRAADAEEIMGYDMPETKQALAQVRVEFDEAQDDVDRALKTLSQLLREPQVSPIDFRVYVEPARNSVLDVRDALRNAIKVYKREIREEFKKANAPQDSDNAGPQDSDAAGPQDSDSEDTPTTGASSE